MSSKGVMLLFLTAVVFFIIYLASSEQTVVLPGSASRQPGVAIFAPMPGVPPLQSIIPLSKQENTRENFTVKFGKTNITSPAGTVTHSGMRLDAISRADASTQSDDCLPPPPPPPQAVESVDIVYRHGAGRFLESAASAAQVQAAMPQSEPSGVRISSFNPLMII